MTAQTISLAPDRSSQNPRPSNDPGSAIPTALVSGNPLLRSGLQQIFEGTRFVVADIAPPRESGRPQPLSAEAALVIIDANQDTGHVLQSIRLVREQFPETRIVVLADRFDSRFIRLGYEAGVDGFCSGASAPEILIKSLELVMLGESALPLEVVRSILDEPHPSRDHTPEHPKFFNAADCKLSPKEMQVLNCLRQGSSNKIIANRLDITEATVKVHVKAILRKVGAVNRTQAAIWATEHLSKNDEASVNA